VAGREGGDEDEEDKTMVTEDLALARGFLAVDPPLDVDVLESPPTPMVPEIELPIMAKRGLIFKTIADNPVTIIQGESK